MTITNMNPSLFLAAAAFASTEQTRYYLRGVYVQHAAGGGLLYTATDGHRLFHAHDMNATMDGDNRIVGIEKPKFTAAWFKVDSLNWDDGILSAADKSLLLPALEVDGSFPDYTRIIPSKPSGDLAHFNYSYLGEVEQVAKKSNLGAIFVHHNGGDPALITFQTSAAVAVLMPLRTDQIESSPPTLPHAAE